MIKYALTNPQILSALASNGHGSKIIITDGNFPVGTATPGSCQKVYLNLCKDVPTVLQVLEMIAATIAVESAIIMIPPNGQAHPIHGEFRKLLGEIKFTELPRLDFYAASKEEEVFLAIVTGDIRRFANIILSMGVYR